MPPHERRVLAQQPTTRDGWLPRGELPPELQQSTARRLGVLGLLTAATFVVIALTNIPHEMRRAVDPALAWIPIACSNCAIVLSLQQRLAALELAREWTQEAAESWWREVREPAAGAASVDPLGETVAP
jgi:hypothetical protein